MLFDGSSQVTQHERCVVYMLGESWDKGKPEYIKKVWDKTLINKVNEIEPTCESIYEESEEGTASTMSHELRRAGFDVSESDEEFEDTVDEMVIPSDSEVYMYFSNGRRHIQSLIQHLSSSRAL